ncbi:MAG: CBS domain-containing protein [Nitrospinaceae bacterium]|nr:CBS domain-containing protein [Nitrospina sp.]MBT5375902.1 CBS domain-containing protein [Nitrospinaceae bacterium]MBT5869758.1 CBS domain-containing protein [Nitrospinaceae bacterium]MBT6347243.1 CBS domain-containing protein [Nitrospina sp.]
MDEIRYFMEENLISVEPTATVAEATQKMRLHSISSILIGKGGQYTDLLTDTDLCRKFAPTDMNPERTLVTQITNTPIISMDGKRLMEDAYECMRSNNIRHLGVTEENNLIGILSVKDFANYFHNKFGQQDGEKGEIQYFMNGSVLSIEAKESVLKATQKMAKHKVGCLIVLDNGKVKGTFSESNLTMDVIAQGLSLDNTRLSSLVIGKLVFIDSTQVMNDAYLKMRENNIRHLAISRDQKIIGILSTKDFANYYSFTFGQSPSEEDQIDNFMQENLVKISQTSSVFEAAQVMKKYKIGALLVTRDDAITGIVTDEIFTRNVLGENLNPKTTLVSDLMIKPTLIDGTESMDSALNCMHRNDVRYLVTTKDAVIKGIISLKDLTIYFKRKFVSAQDIDE